MKGLKRLREEDSSGPVDPNHYWARTPRKRCAECGRRIRGKNHKKGH